MELCGEEIPRENRLEDLAENVGLHGLRRRGLRSRRGGVGALEFRGLELVEFSRRIGLVLHGAECGAFFAGVNAVLGGERPDVTFDDPEVERVVPNALWTLPT